MPTRNISLTKQLDDFVEKNVSTGEYQNASEVMRDALRLLQLRQKEDKLKLHRLRDAIDVGLRQLDKGAYVRLERDEIGPWVASLGKAEGRKSRRRRA